MTNKPLSKKELRNIINQGWEERREKVKKAAEHNNETTKEWLVREKKIKNGLIDKDDLPVRRRHYTGPLPS